MKQMKRCAALLLALVMVFSMALTASAAEGGSITVEGATAGKIYSIFKIFDLTMASQSAVAYTIDSDWEDFFQNEGAKYIVEENTGSLNPITVSGMPRYINITEANVAEFSQAALAYAVDLDADDTQTAGEETLVFSGLELGYYLVYPQGAADIKDGYSCICSLTSTVPDATVQVKATYPVIEKTDDAVSADLGQVIHYTVTGTVPDTTGFETYEYTVEDTMSAGLTFGKDVAVTFGGQDIAVQADYEAIENGFRLTFGKADLQAHAGKDIVITYTAKVNENAVVKDTVQKNKAVLIYSNDPNNSENKTTNPPVEEEVYSSRVIIDKIDGADKETRLAGAEFVLKNSDGSYYILTDGEVTWGTKEEATVRTTDENGTADFPGLKNGIYQLEEIKAPDGYNLLTETVEVRVNETGTSQVSVSVTSQVENNSGTTLPDTGGMGTTVLYGLGGLLVAAAFVMLLARRRMGSL